MDISPFTIEYQYADALEFAIIRPNAGKNKIENYTVWHERYFAFTVTKNAGQWVVTLKNAAEVEIDAGRVQVIGAQIDKVITERSKNP